MRGGKKTDEGGPQFAIIPAPAPPPPPPPAPAPRASANSVSTTPTTVGSGGIGACVCACGDLLAVRYTLRNTLRHVAELVQPCARQLTQSRFAMQVHPTLRFQALTIAFSLPYCRCDNLHPRCRD